MNMLKVNIPSSKLLPLPNIVSSSLLWALLSLLAAFACRARPPELPDDAPVTEVRETCSLPDRLTPAGDCIEETDFAHCSAQIPDSTGNCYQWGFEGYDGLGGQEGSIICGPEEKMTPSGVCIYEEAYDHCQSQADDPTGDCQAWGFDGYDSESQPQENPPPASSCNDGRIKAPNGSCILQADYDQCSSNPSAAASECANWGFDVPSQPPTPQPENPPESPCPEGQEQAPNGECILKRDFHYCSLGAWDGTGRCKKWGFPGY